MLMSIKQDILLLKLFSIHFWIKMGTKKVIHMDNVFILAIMILIKQMSFFIPYNKISKKWQS